MGEPSSVSRSGPVPGVCVLSIERPERLNALNMGVKAALVAGLTAASEDPAVHVIIVTGSATVFVAGTDVAEMVDMTPESHAALGTNGLFVALRACPKPLIAAVEGFALGGGCELALACDMIVAGVGARFGQPEIRVGIMPGAGGTQILARTIGKYRAMRLVLTGDQIDAEEAMRAGLVSEVVPEGEALDRAIVLAQRICTMPPLAVRASKQAVAEAFEVGLTEGLARERRAFEQLFASADQKEGMRAFLEKRAPQYVGQ